MEINENVSIEELINQTNHVLRLENDINAIRQLINQTAILDVSNIEFITSGGYNFKGALDYGRLTDYDDDLRDRDCFVADDDFVIKSLPFEKYYARNDEMVFQCAPVQIRKNDIIIYKNNWFDDRSRFRILVFRHAECIGTYNIIRVLRGREDCFFPDIFVFSTASNEDTTTTKLKNKIDEDNNIAECAICVEEKKTINLKCQGKHDHTYCFDCFKKWYIDQNHKSCVLCFSEFDVKNICAPLVE